ncbi:MAG: hypothetical protein WD847_16335 [Pirellulales bacterium]
MNNSENSSNTSGPTDARFATPRDLAGAHYEEMNRSKEAALAFLSAPNYRTRLAAILICEQVWHAASEPRVLEACRSIAESDADDSIRDASICVLGRALSSTKDPIASLFVARIVLDSQNSAELRTSAYWVLREIQYGVADVDFDTFFRGTIHIVKECLKALPSRFSEESVKSALLPDLPDGCFPHDFWDSADWIDWDCVRRMG